MTATYHSSPRIFRSFSTTGSTRSQHISVTGYANVGLQLFLPLGPHLALFGFDGAAYSVETNAEGHVRIADGAQIRLINDLQWEAAHAVLLAATDTPLQELKARAAFWSSRRQAERTVFREEVVEQSDSQVRTRHGSGQAPSKISLDLSFIVAKLTKPPPLGRYEIPPFRDPQRVARTDRAFEWLDAWDEQRRSQ